jgi:hypothetical protein
MSNGLLAGMVFCAVSIGNLTMASDEGMLPAQLRITIYQQAHLPQEVMESMFHQLRLIFRLAGVAVDLVTGDPAADEATLFTYPRLPPKGHEHEFACRARRDIALKIADVSPSGVPRTILGIAAPLARSGLNARVFNDHIIESAMRHNRPHANVLACAIAHEIGHVLLRSSDHRMSGLMSAVWTGPEYTQMEFTGRMLFTPEESKTMRANLNGTACPKEAVLGHDSASFTGFVQDRQ